MFESPAVQRGRSNRLASSRRIVTGIGGLAMALVLAACSSATTPVPSPTVTNPPTLEASLQPTILPPTLEPTVSASPTDTPEPSTSSAPVAYKVLIGKAKLLAPAEDRGARAGLAIDQFAFDLLARLDASGNLVLSPSSIALALSMVQPGARGATAAEMDKVLHGLGSDANGSEMVALLNAFAADTIYTDAAGYPILDGQKPPKGAKPVCELRVSNAAFMQTGMPVQQAYLDALSSRFGAGVGTLDFAANPESARLTINKWASDKTSGRIPNVLQPGDIDKNTRYALANAIYFHAAWQAPFDAKDTASKPFHLADGTTVSVPTMSGSRLTTYAAAKGWRAVRLGYTGSRTSMTFVVPDDMAAFQKTLTAATYNDIVGRLALYNVQLTMPRFSTETRLQLADKLVALGMTTAFDSRTADLSGITGSRDTYLDKVIHMANIDVVEQGTTAAAVTVVTGAGMPAPPKTVKLAIDKPFLYFITDNDSGAILFMGRVANPATRS
jgi:serpin B